MIQWVHIEVHHEKALKPYDFIEVVAKLTEIEDRKLTFSIEVYDEAVNRVGIAKHTRFIINVEKFLSKLIN